MSDEQISQEFSFKTIDETRNYFIKEIKRNDFISKKYKKIHMVLNYIKRLLILVTTVTHCV